MDFGMFTEAGNALVRGIVLTARAANLDWEQVYDIMSDASTLDGYEEIMDTEVREIVYSALKRK